MPRAFILDLRLQQLTKDMHKKVKNTNKENLKNNKKIPLITIPNFNVTEEIRIPTLSSNELKNMVKSIELRKTTTLNPYKKSVSRKSTCKSVKQTANFRPPELKTIMQTFKQLKLMHDNSRSKSKSPASCKSRSMKKYFPKRKSYATLVTKPNSQVNLTLKLEKTIKQLNEADFFRDEDSMLPIKSSSDIMQSDERPKIVSTENEEDIDLSEMRKFCSTSLRPEKSTIELSMKNYNSFKENRAALKIQTAWKRFQTRRLVERYTNFYNVDYQPQEPNFSHEAPIQPNDYLFSENTQLNLQGLNQIGDEIIVTSEEFYPENINGNKVRHISNLEEEVKSASSDYEEIVKRMKMEELQKWNEIIKIISLNKSDNPQELERLLEKLTEQSEINKKDLESKANTILGKSQRKKQIKTEEMQEYEKSQQHEARREIRCEYSSSDHSMALEEYDSKKYIEYLDGDIFPIENDHSSNSSQAPNCVKISKKKQELLLEELKTSNLPIKLGESELYHSESMKGLEKGHRRQTSKSSSRSTLRKSTSQKILRNSIDNMSNNSLDHSNIDEIEQTSEINLDLLTKEFLQGSDPSADNFDMVYSEEKLKSKLAELSKMKEEYLNEENAQRQEEHIFLRDEEEDEYGEEMAQLRRSHPAYQLHHTLQEEIKIEDGTPEKMQVEVVEAEIASDSDNSVNEQVNEKGETCATMVLNTIILEALKDIAKSERLSESFKSFSLSLKPKIRKFEGNKKKKGFPTSKAEIELFLEGLMKYLNKEQPHIFKNLEVSTGPSALQMLRYMHQLGEEQLQEQSDDEDESNVMVVPNRVFDAFWQLKEKSIIIEVPQHFDQSNTIIFKHQFQLLKSFNKIFYRSLFDTFNECLDCQRNFGQYGRPFPWKKAPIFDHNKSQDTLNQQVQKARKKMIDLSTTYCGLIIQKEDMVNSINEEYIKQVHEDRLSRMLATDLIEAQDRWIFYDDEQTEILVEISNALYTELLIEVIEELYEYI